MSVRWQEQSLDVSCLPSSRVQLQVALQLQSVGGGCCRLGTHDTRELQSVAVTIPTIILILRRSAMGEHRPKDSEGGAAPPPASAGPPSHRKLLCVMAVLSVSWLAGWLALHPLLSELNQKGGI